MARSRTLLNLNYEIRARKSRAADFPRDTSLPLPVAQLKFVAAKWRESALVLPQFETDIVGIDML